MAAGDVTTITVESKDVHDGRLVSIKNWINLPDGAVLVKVADNQIAVVEPIADGTITLASTTSITTKYGVIVSKVDA